MARRLSARIRQVAVETRRFVISLGTVSLSLLAMAGAYGADVPAAEMKFTPDELWQAEWLDKTAPSPFTLTPDPKGAGLAVSFTESTADVTCGLRGLRWRTIDPLGIAPSSLSIDVALTSGNGVTLTPRVIDGNGTIFELAPKPVLGGTLTWALPGDVKSKVITVKRAEGLEPVAVGLTLTGPIFLDQFKIQKTAGAAAALKFTGGRVIDPQAGTMAMGKIPLFKFNFGENWFDVNAFDTTVYTIGSDANGLTITYGPTTKKQVFKLSSFIPLTQTPGGLGRPSRIITDVELAEGPAGCASIGLGLKDSENEVLGSKPIDLVPGHNQLVWDSSQVSSPWRGGHNGVCDFPCNLDDYTLVMNATPIETKVILHSAYKEELHQLLYQTGYDADRPLFVWKEGEVAPLKVHLSNSGGEACQRPFDVSLTDDQEHPIWSKSIAADVPAHGSGDLAIDVDTKGLAQGVYVLKWSSSEATDNIHGLALLTVADLTKPPKAKDGEFLYGIDIGGMWQTTNLLDWADWIGVDVVRNCGRSEFFRSGITDRDLQDTSDALAELDKRGMKANIMFSPNTPWDKDPAKFDAIIQNEAKMTGIYAQKFKGRFLWYEYGNEPSLQPFFFHGPPADYAKIFDAVSDAIKAADPTAKVTNGGFAFAGAGGAEQRADEMAKLIPADKIDAWAYHGHGDGAKAERFYLGLMKKAANYPDKKDKPYYETESGSTSTDPVTWRSQTRTLVQKLVFAQSTHVVPVFLYFGLHPEWEWGILQNFQEAKPAALAYRVLVQQTRGLSAQSPLDLAGAPGEGYWFKSDSGQTVVVLWSDAGVYTRNIALGSDAKDVKRVDMFGNAQPLTLSADGTTQIQAGLDPIYVTAQRSAQAAPVTVQPPALELPQVVKVIPGTTATVPVVVHNHASSDLHGSLMVTPAGGAPIDATQLPVTVAAGQQSTVNVPIQVKDVPAPWWPRSWVVFAPVEGNVDLSTITAIPDSLPTADGKTTGPQVGLPVNDHLDLGPLGGGHHERRQAICFAQVTVPETGDYEFGASADFWMEWWVNGTRVLNTMDKGNEGSLSVMTHLVKAHFNKGVNLMAVRVLSGSVGWELISGGPEEINAARQAAGGIVTGSVLELKDGNNLLDHESVKIETIAPLAVQDKTDPSAWATQGPDAANGTVNNLFKAAPDESHWYKGKDDLSARFWYRVKPDGSLLIEGAVTDDIDQPGDGIHIEVASGDGWKNVFKLSSGEAKVTRQRDEAAKITWYQATIPQADLGVKPREKIAIRVNINDDDWGVLKQTTSTAFASDPETWFQGWIAP